MFIVKCYRFHVGGVESVFSNPGWSFSVSLGSLQDQNANQGSNDTLQKVGDRGGGLKQAARLHKGVAFPPKPDSLERNTQECQREPVTEWSLANVCNTWLFPKGVREGKF